MNRISSLFNFIANKIGNVAMGTTANTVTGAIAEHETDITHLQEFPALKYYYFSTGTRSWPSGTTTATVEVPNAPSDAYQTWCFGPRATNVHLRFVLAFQQGQVTIYGYNDTNAAISCAVNGFMVYLNTDNAITL